MSDQRRLISPIAATLLKAARLLETRGWCQRKGETDTGAICPRRALEIVADIPTAAAAGNHLSRFLWERHKMPLERWNDAPWRTEDEVIAAMCGAAARLMP